LVLIPNRLSFFNFSLRINSNKSDENDIIIATDQKIVVASIPREGFPRTIKSDNNTLESNVKCIRKAMTKYGIFLFTRPEINIKLI